MLNPRLQAAVDALIAEVADTKSKLESVKVFIQGIPELVACAVAEALAAHAVTDEAAAASIDAARLEISGKVDVVFAAITVNTPDDDHMSNSNTTTY